MAKNAKPELIMVSSKGQVIIPQGIRRKLGFKAKLLLLAYCYKDAVVLKKVRVPNAVEQMQRIWRRVDRRIERGRLKALSEKEINDIVQKFRHAEAQAPR